MPNFNRRKLPLATVPEVLRHKWSYPVMDEGYTPVPKRLLRCLSQLFPDTRDLQAVLAIVDFERPNLTRLPSLDYLAFIAGLPEEVFRERIQAMQQQGLIMYSGPDDGLSFDTGPLRDKIVELTGESPTPPSSRKAASLQIEEEELNF